MSPPGKIDEYFMEQTNQHLKEMREDIKDLKLLFGAEFKDVKAQNNLILNRYNFLWGGVIAISAVISLGITIVFGR